MTERNTRPLAKTAVFVIIGIAVIAYMVSACSWFDVRPARAPVPDPDVESGRLVRLTHTNSTETNPVWSPGGDKIAFECLTDDKGGIWPFSSYSSPGDDGEVRNWPISSGTYRLSTGDAKNWPLTSIGVFGNICVMNADGSGRTKLTDDWSDNRDPAWSPDGSRIAYWSSRDGSRDIHVVNADGSGRVTLTDPQVTEIARAQYPAWSPDGRKIAYTLGNYPERNIYVMNADGSDARPITQDVFNAERPAWSPDGSKLAFRSYDVVGEGSWIYVVDADGSNLTRITQGPRNRSDPIWVHDENRIAYVSYKEGSKGIYRINADGSGRTSLYKHLDRGRLISSPAWSPDGKRIAFAVGGKQSGGGDYSEIYTINVDGSGISSLTYRSSRDTDPSWNPDGTKLAFTSDLVGNTEIYVIPYR